MTIVGFIWRSIEDDEAGDQKCGIGPHSLYSIDFEQNQALLDNSIPWLFKVQIVPFKDDDEEALETEMFTNIGQNQVGDGGGWLMFSMMIMITMILMMISDEYNDDDPNNDEDDAADDDA